MNRPLLWAGAAFALGITLGAQTSPGFFLSTTLVTAAIAWAVAARSLAVRDRALILCVFLAAGLAEGWVQARHVDLDPLAVYARDHLPSGASWTVEGIVRTGLLYREGENGRFVLDVDTVHLPDQDLALHGGVSVRCFAPEGPIFAGERVRARGRVELAFSPVNHGVNSIDDYLRARGINSALSAASKDIDHLGVHAWRPSYWLGRFRQAEASLLARSIPAASLPFVLAVWLGEGATIGHDEYDAFIASGTAHVLSVSGVHVAIVYIMLSALFGGIVKNRKRRAAVIILGVFVYSLLAGAQVATLRSAVMFALYLGAELFDREPDAPTALGLSALLFLVFRPGYIADAGFLLSFASVASMLLLNDPIANRLPWRLGPLRPALATTISAQVLSLPLAAHYFHLVPIYGVAANFIVVPLLTCVLWLCLLTTLGGMIYTPIGMLFGYATHIAVASSRWLVAFFAGLPGSYTMVSSPAWYAVPFFWLAALLFARALRENIHPRRYWIAAALCFATSVLLWTPRPDGAGIDMLDVGHGDSMLVRTPGGTTLLIDGGDRDAHRDLGRSVVEPFLLAHGVRHLDYVVVTHPDSDHIGGLFEIVRRFSVGQVLMSASESDARLEKEFVDLCAQRDVPVQRLKRGDHVDAPGAEIEAMHPPEGWGAGEAINNRCLVLRIAWPGFSLLCAGDIERPAEQLIAQAGDYHVQFLKVPHHGSGTSSSETFLDAVAPEAALCSTGPKPNRRPMDDRVIARFGERGILLKRTDYLGGLHIREVNHTWNILSAREARGYSLAPVSSDSSNQIPTVPK